MFSQVGRLIPDICCKKKCVQEIGMVVAAKRVVSDADMTVDMVIGDINLMALMVLCRRRIPVILFRDHHLVQPPMITNRMITRHDHSSIKAIIVNNEAALFETTGFNEIIYPTVRYDFNQLYLTPLQEVFPNLPNNLLYFVAIGDFKKSSNLPVAMRAFDSLFLKMDKNFEGHLFVISYLSEDEDDTQDEDGFKWLSFEHSQLVYKKSIILIRKTTMSAKKSLISNCLAVLHPESEVESYDSLLSCLSLGALTICVDSICARNVIMHRLTGMLVQCKENTFLMWMIKIIEYQNFVTYMRYMIQIDFDFRFSSSAFSERVTYIIYYKVVSCGKVPMIESKISTFSRLDLIWTLLEANKVGCRGKLSLEKLHDIIVNFLPPDGKDGFKNRVNIAENILLQELYLQYAILKQQLLIQVDKLLRIIKFYSQHQEFSTNFAHHMVYISSIIYMPIQFESPPTSVCNIDDLQADIHALNTDFAVHNLLVKTFVLMEEVATDFFRILNKIRVTVKPGINAVLYLSVCLDVESLPVLNEDITTKLKYYVENLPPKKLNTKP